MARIAVDMALARLRAPETPPENIVLKSVLVVRDSTGAGK